MTHRSLHSTRVDPGSRRSTMAPLSTRPGRAGEAIKRSEKLNAGSPRAPSPRAA